MKKTTNTTVSITSRTTTITKEENIMKKNNQNANNEINLAEYIQPGAYGYTRTQMVAAMKKVLEEDKEKALAVFKALYNKFPDVFTASVRYIPAYGRRLVYNNFELQNNFDVITPGTYGVTKTQVLATLNLNYDNTDYVKAIFAKFPTMANGCFRYMKNNVRTAVKKALNSEWTFASEFKYINNKKLAELIMSNAKVAKTLNEQETKLAKDAVMDMSTKKIAEKNNITKDKVYDTLFRNNGKSVLTRQY